MSEETTPTTDPAEETGKGLRAQLEKTLAKNKVLEAREMKRSFDDLDLSLDEGLGKAIAKEYGGDITTEAIAAYAKDEYGYEFTPQAEQDPQAAQIADGQARLDQVGQTAGSVAPPTEADALAEAEAKGDYATTMAIKGAQIARQFQGS